MEAGYAAHQRAAEEREQRWAQAQKADAAREGEGKDERQRLSDKVSRVPSNGQSGARPGSALAMCPHRCVCVCVRGPLSEPHQIFDLCPHVAMYPVRDVAPSLSISVSSPQCSTLASPPPP